MRYVTFSDPNDISVLALYLIYIKLIGFKK